MNFMWMMTILRLFDFASGQEEEDPPHYRLYNALMRRYSPKLIPRKQANVSIQVAFSLDLYQIIEVNEPHQQLALNTWVVEKWDDELLGWRPEDFEGITELLIPADSVWIPDTMLYNTLVMDDADTRRLGNAKLTTNGRSSRVELLYPTIYRFSCVLDLRFFPFDVQHCKMTFGSWTFDNTKLNYSVEFEDGEAIGTSNAIQNGEWSILGTSAFGRAEKFNCCPNNYTLLYYHIWMKRKPLYWVVNLIGPTSLITFISIVGFFSTSSINDIREEKITLGITTLLSMSILIFMVSDKIPLGWFYSCMIMLISFATLAAQVVIYVQKKSVHGAPPKPSTMRLAHKWGWIVGLRMPPAMLRAYYDAKAEVEKQDHLRRHNVRLHSTSPHIHKHFNAVDVATLVNQNHAEPKDWMVNDFSMASPCSVTSTRRRSSIMSDTQRVVVHEQQKVETFRVQPRRPGPATPPSATPPAVRTIAEYEYDWLAAVIERQFGFFFNKAFRSFLIGFVLLFVVMVLGINAVGVYYWYFANLAESV